tara:strand:+ start:2472 stop:3176 length:705 start_codon:yes stop_codon:yes gene_type:complete
MSTINLDLSQKVDITCREGDDLFLVIGATDENGGPLEVSLDTVHLFTIRDLKKEPIKIMSGEQRIHSDMTDLVANFNQAGEATPLADDYVKRAFAIQKIINSREINATAFSDKYHPRRTQQFNSLIGGANAPFNVRTKETADKIWFSQNPNFEMDGTQATYSAPFFYNSTLSQFQLHLDSVGFDLPVGKYKYDIKILAGLYCPTDNETNEPIVEKAVYESVTTLIFGTLDVKKD